MCCDGWCRYIKLMIQWKAMFSVSTLLTHFLEVKKSLPIS
jgi:hypothetical protein